jgi:hypothetical protein
MYSSESISCDFSIIIACLTPFTSAFSGAVLQFCSRRIGIGSEVFAFLSNFLTILIFGFYLLLRRPKRFKKQFYKKQNWVYAFVMNFGLLLFWMVLGFSTLGDR